MGLVGLAIVFHEEPEGAAGGTKTAEQRDGGGGGGDEGDMLVFSAPCFFVFAGRVCVCRS